MHSESLPGSGHPLSSALGTERERACKKGQRGKPSYPNRKEEEGKQEVVSTTESISSARFECFF